MALNDGGVDILINNGGMGFRGTVLETELSVQQKVMKVNYFGSVALTKGKYLIYYECKVISELAAMVIMACYKHC